MAIRTRMAARNDAVAAAPETVAVEEMTMNTKNLIWFSLLATLLVLQTRVAYGDDPPPDRGVAQQVQQLQAQVAALQARLAALEANTVLQLDRKLSLDTTDPEQPTALFTAVNVQVVNGLNATETTNKLGNLIVGYNEPNRSPPLGTTGTPLRSGSHNIVVGSENAYESFGGLVAGFRNIIKAKYASISGGTGNEASGPLSSISGGDTNRARGLSSSVTGGSHNAADGQNSSVTGGSSGQAIGGASNVSGGFANVARGKTSSVSGGFANGAGGENSSVLGGRFQDATLEAQTIPALP